MNIKEGYDAVIREVGKYDAVVLWDIHTMDRNVLLKYCYSHSIRVYMMPKIPDVLVKGSEQLHLFDTPILLTREYALNVEQRIAKRFIDVVCSLILIVVTSPVMLITAVVIKLYDKGPVLYKQVRCTKDAKEFYILKFRSMRVDAEKDGVARLAAKNDSRITPVGKFYPCGSYRRAAAAVQHFKGRDVLYRSQTGAAADHPRIYRRNAGVRIPYQSEGRACGICAGIRKVQYNAL